MRRAYLFLLLPLAACATPQQQCISAATKDLRVLNSLASSTQANINRGYAIEIQQELVIETRVCGEFEGEKVYCDVPETVEKKVPIAIDLEVEQAKLNSLLKRQRQMQANAEKAVQSCRVNYPEA
jgi:hypothetical protein